MADQLDISVGAVHTALAYYYDHPEEMRILERERRESERALAERSLMPPEQPRDQGPNG